MISYETHILPNSDYYVYTPSTLAKKLFFYPICIGSFRYESGYRLARDSYDSFLMMYILKGTCFVTVGSHTMQAMLKDAGYQVPEINMEAYMKVRGMIQEFMDDFLGLYKIGRAHV